jgi:hypothetical protein
VLNDFKDSIKAKLYDFNYTPFMSSLVISWIVINHKYLLVLFSDKLDIDKKLIMLNDTYSYNAVHSCFGFYILPLVFALFYVFGYPRISKIFYEYTLKQTKKLKEIKQKIEDETPLTQEEARWHRVEMEKLIQRNNSLEGSLAGEQKRYEEQVQIKIELETSKIREENIALQEQLDNAYTYEEGLQGEIRNKEKEIDFLKQELENLKIESANKVEENLIEDDEMKILKYLYESNYKTTYRDSAINNIVSATKIPRVVVEKIVNELILKDTLTHNAGAVGDPVSISKKGGEYLMELFYKK